MQGAGSRARRFKKTVGGFSDVGCRVDVVHKGSRGRTLLLAKNTSHNCLSLPLTGQSAPKHA